MDIMFDLKLNFDDVLIRPKRSTLSSRSEVNLGRELGRVFPLLLQIWIQ